MQILHLGLHKTGTTSLQKNLFTKAGISYYGLHGPNWDRLCPQWMEFFSANGPAPVSGGESFVYSYEATLLRCGGISGLEHLACKIADSFAEPRLLITVREPSALLVSAYFQSLRLRRSAIGFREQQHPIFQDSTRFLEFAKWWSLLERESAHSLAGLLDYPCIKQILEAKLGADRVVFLRLEDLVSTSSRYPDRLKAMGFRPETVMHFMQTPAENTGDDKKLQKQLPWLTPVGHLLQQSGLYLPLGKMLRYSALIRPMEKILYSGNPLARKRIDPRLVDLIRERYAENYAAIA